MGSSGRWPAAMLSAIHGERSLYLCDGKGSKRAVTQLDERDRASLTCYDADEKTVWRAA